MTAAIDTGTDELLGYVDERVAVLTLNRPESRNALSDRLSPALRATIAKLASDDGVGCVVLTGAGTAFCAGGDVKGMAGGPGIAGGPGMAGRPGMAGGPRAPRTPEEVAEVEGSYTGGYLAEILREHDA